MYYPETVVRVRASTATDAHGNAARSWGTATSTNLVGVQVQPVESAEPDKARAARVTRMKILTAVGTDLDLLGTDRVTWDGYTWEVEGDAVHHKSPRTGAIHHGEAIIRRVAG